MMTTTTEAPRTDGAFLADVLAGLSKRPRRLPPKYFYDHAGSLLFDAICELPEYYVTRTELAILRAHVGAIAARLPRRVRVVEPGAGSGIKTRLLVEALGPDRCVSWIPVDIAREFLTESAERMRRDVGWLRVSPVVADFARELPVPPAHDGVATVVFFPGSTIGNFDPADATDLLASFRRATGRDGAVVLGADLKKDPAAIHAAYNDSQGVTAAFNKNLLVRMNRELGADFDLDAYWHHALYDPTHGRIEMHLVSMRRQTVTIAGSRFELDEGESICTERSYKYDLPSVARMALGAGLVLSDAWLDDERRFAELLLEPIA